MFIRSLSTWNVKCRSKFTKHLRVAVLLSYNTLGKSFLSKSIYCWTLDLLSMPALCFAAAVAAVAPGCPEIPVSVSSCSYLLFLATVTGVSAATITQRPWLPALHMFPFGKAHWLSSQNRAVWTFHLGLTRDPLIHPFWLCRK